MTWRYGWPDLRITWSCQSGMLIAFGNFCVSRHSPCVLDVGSPFALVRAIEHGSHVHGRHRAAQVVGPREHVPQTMRQTHYPLSQRNVGQHVVDEVGCPFSHAAPATTRTEPAPPCRRTARGDRDRSRRSGSARIPPRDIHRCGIDLSRLHAKRLVVIADHLEQDALRGIARLAAACRSRHATRVASGVPAARRGQSGRIRDAATSGLALSATPAFRANRRACHESIARGDERPPCRRHGMGGRPTNRRTSEPGPPHRARTAGSTNSTRMPSGSIANTNRPNGR